MTNINYRIKIFSGYTLIELLVVISVIAILLGLSLFSIDAARKSSRDSRRRADLELIRSALELYKADCNVYPSSITFGGSLSGGGVGVPATCGVGNTYMSSIPLDPKNPARLYIYNRGLTATTYELCSALEQTSGTATCGGGGICGTGVTCNYKVTNP